MWTCSLYLAHGASTVRQACSSLFLKFMAKRDQGAGSLQRLVLQGLSTTCTPPLEPDSDGASGSVEGTGGPAGLLSLLAFLVQNSSTNTDVLLSSWLGLGSCGGRGVQ